MPDPSKPILPADVQGFEATRWSLVAVARGEVATSARRALIDLCLRYAYPVYAYLRGCGHEAMISRDICRGFFDHLVDSRVSGAGEGGSFRHFLLQTLHRYLSSDWRLSADAAPSAEFENSLDWEALEQRYRIQSQPQSTPEQGFERSYALEVLETAMAKLAAEAERAERGELFRALQPLLSKAPLPGEIEALAGELKLAPLAVVVALKRLRQRFRELARDELVQTVSSAEDLASEREHLSRSLGL